MQVNYCPVVKKPHNCEHSEERKTQAREKDKLRKQKFRTKIKEEELLKKVEEHRVKVTESRLQEMQLPSLPPQNPNAVNFINTSRYLLENLVKKKKN